MDINKYVKGINSERKLVLQFKEHKKYFLILSVILGNLRKIYHYYLLGSLLYADYGQYIQLLKNSYKEQWYWLNLQFSVKSGAKLFLSTRYYCWSKNRILAYFSMFWWLQIINTHLYACVWKREGEGEECDCALGSVGKISYSSTNTFNHIFI